MRLLSATRRATVATALPALALMLAGSPLAAQSTLLSNLPAATSTFFSTLSPTSWKAVAFNTGAQASTFVSLEAAFLGNVLFTRGVTGGIHANDVDQPGVELASFNTVTLNTTTDAFQTGIFTTAAPFLLEANSTYYLLLRGTTADAAAWAGSISTPPTPGAGSLATLGPGRLTQDAGATWGVGGNGNFFALQASVVPEPSTYALLGTGLVGLACVRRRRTQR